MIFFDQFYLQLVLTKFLYLLDCCRYLWMLSIFKKIQKILEFFKNYLKFFKILEKNEYSKTFFEIQIALKNLLFELWPNKKMQGDVFMKITLIYIYKKIFSARALPRVARAEYHIAVITQKICFFGIGDRIFWARARGSARAPKIF